MARKIELSKLSEKELVQLRKDVDTALSSLAAQKKQDALKAAKAEAEKRGFSLDDLMESKKVRKKKQSSVPKYRHPENPEATWAGRGRRPRWIEEALAGGHSLDDFAI